MRKFEQYIKYQSMDRRKKKVVLKIKNRCAPIDKFESINQYLQKMVDSQFEDSYLNKFAKTVDFDNMTDSDEEEQKEYNDNNNSSDNYSNFNANNQILNENNNNNNHSNINTQDYNNSNDLSENSRVLSDSASEYTPPNVKQIKNKAKHSDSENQSYSDSDSASDYLEQATNKNKKGKKK